MSITFKYGKEEQAVSMPPQRSIMNELLSRGMVTSNVAVIYRGKPINPKVCGG